MTTLYAWLNPTSFDPLVDHTWVTDYPTPSPPHADIAAVAHAGGTYWFCWGTYHPQGHSKKHAGGAIGHQPGDLSLAKCVCAPMLSSKGHPSAQGTINTYGVDGVCHQLANQVLYATGSPGRPPLRVRKARGYKTSTWLWGTYGRDTAKWQMHVAQCKWQMLGRGLMRDDFLTSLPKNLEPEKVLRLLELRAAFQSRVQEFRTARVNAADAERINRLIHDHLAQAETFLTPAEYERVFGHPPQQKPKLVDPEMM
jgi:hypothetical protein